MKLFAFAFVISTLASAAPKKIGCYRDVDGKTALFVKIEQENTASTYHVVFKKSGKIIDVRDLTCKFSEAIEYVLDCTGPDYKGDPNYGMKVTLSEEVKHYSDGDRRETLMMVNRIKKGSVDGFALEGLMLEPYHSHGKFQGFCRAD